MSYQTAVAHWAVKQNATMRWRWDNKVMNHLLGMSGKTDACRLDPESVGTVTFESLEGGSCETCAYSYLAATFNASCMCGKVKNKTFEVEMPGGKGLDIILEEVMACEPYNIAEMSP